MIDLLIGFIGLGLIGGSIAKSLKKNIFNLHITAFDVNDAILRCGKSCYEYQLHSHRCGQCEN